MCDQTLNVQTEHVAFMLIFCLVMDRAVNIFGYCVSCGSVIPHILCSKEPEEMKDFP